MWALLSLFTFFQLQLEVGHALSDIGKELAEYAYLYEHTEISSIPANLSIVYAAYLLNEKMEQEPASKRIEGNI